VAILASELRSDRRQELVKSEADARREVQERLRRYVQDRLDEFGWTQKELSMRTGVIGPPMIARILQGQTVRMTVDQLVGLARAFDTTPQNILETIGEWPSETEQEEDSPSGYLHRDMLDSIQSSRTTELPPEGELDSDRDAEDRRRRV